MELPQELVDQVTTLQNQTLQLATDIYNAGFQAGSDGQGVQALIDAAVAAKVQQFVDWYAQYDTAQDDAFAAIVNP